MYTVTVSENASCLPNTCQSGRAPADIFLVVCGAHVGLYRPHTAVCHFRNSKRIPPDGDHVQSNGLSFLPTKPVLANYLNAKESVLYRV